MHPARRATVGTRVGMGTSLQRGWGVGIVSNVQRGSQQARCQQKVLNADASRTLATLVSSRPGKGHGIRGLRSHFVESTSAEDLSQEMVETLVAYPTILAMCCWRCLSCREPREIARQISSQTRDPVSCCPSAQPSGGLAGIPFIHSILPLNLYAPICTSTHRSCSSFTRSRPADHTSPMKGVQESSSSSSFVGIVVVHIVHQSTSPFIPS